MVPHTVSFVIFLRSPTRDNFAVSNVVWTFGSQVSGWVIFALDIEILISFAVLNDRLNAKFLTITRIVLVSLWILLDLPAFVYMSRLIGTAESPELDILAYISLLVVVYSPALLIVYDNVQSIFLMVKLRRIKNFKLEGELLDLCVILTVLIALDLVGVGCAIFALYFDGSSNALISTHELYSSFGFSMHGVLSIVVFSTLRSIALRKKSLKKKFVSSRRLKIEVVPTVIMETEGKSRILVTPENTIKKGVD